MDVEYPEKLDENLSFEEFKNNFSSNPDNYATDYASYLTELSNFRVLLDHEQTTEKPGQYRVVFLKCRILG